jgi:Zn-dependent protease with chaperone function
MSISIPFPARARIKGEPGLWLDLLIGRLPPRVFGAGEEALFLGSWLLIACLSLPAALGALLILVWFETPDSLIAPRDHLAVLRADAPTMRRIWQPRYFLMRRCARIMAARAGIATPEIIIGNGEARGGINASAISTVYGSAIVVEKSVFAADFAAILDDTAIAGLIAHEIGHLVQPRRQAQARDRAHFTYVVAMFWSNLVCGFLWGTPTAVILITCGTAVSLWYLHLLTERRGELEADFAGSSYFERNGRSAILNALLSSHLADAVGRAARSQSKRVMTGLMRTAGEANQFGLLSVSSHDLTEIASGWSRFDRRVTRLRLNYWRLRLIYQIKYPFSDHPRNRAVAKLLGLAEIDPAVVLDAAHGDLFREQKCQLTINGG